MICSGANIHVKNTHEKLISEVQQIHVAPDGTKPTIVIKTSLSQNSCVLKITCFSRKKKKKLYEVPSPSTSLEILFKEGG